MDRKIANNPEHAMGYEQKAFLIIDVWGDLRHGEEILEEARKNVTMEKWRLIYDEYRISIIKRDYNKALKIDLPKEYSKFEFYYRAILLRLMHKNNKARIYFDSLRIQCLKELKYQPVKDYFATIASLAIAYAGLGDKINALNEIAKLDSSYKVYASIDVAYFYILLGDNESAIQSLDTNASKFAGPGREF